MLTAPESQWCRFEHCTVTELVASGSRERAVFPSSVEYGTQWVSRTQVSPHSQALFNGLVIPVGLGLWVQISYSRLGLFVFGDAAAGFHALVCGFARKPVVAKIVELRLRCLDVASRFNSHSAQCK